MCGLSRFGLSRKTFQLVGGQIRGFVSLPRQPFACPSWTCFLCILLVANINIMHLKMTVALAWGLSFPARAHLSLPLHLSLSFSLSLSISLSFFSFPAWHTSLCASALFSTQLKGPLLSVKHRYLSNFTCKYSLNHSTAIVFVMCNLFDFIRRQLDYESGFLWLTSWKWVAFQSLYLILIPLSDNRKSNICICV